MTNSCLNDGGARGRGVERSSCAMFNQRGHLQSDRRLRCCTDASSSVASQVLFFIYFFSLPLVCFFFPPRGRLRKYSGGGPRDESPVVEPSPPPLGTRLGAERGSCGVGRTCEVPDNCASSNVSPVLRREPPGKTYFNNPNSQTLPQSGP